MTLAHNKRKGARAEIELLDWFTDCCYSAARIRLNGANDEGDLHLFRGNNRLDIIEVKSGAHLAIAQWLRETELEAANAQHHRPGVDVHGHLVIRPNGVTDPARWWVIRRVEDVWR